MIVKPFHSNHIISILKIYVASFHIFIFFHNDHFFSGHLQLRQSNIFSIKVGELKKLSKYSMQCVFSNFFDKSKMTVSPSPGFDFSFFAKIKIEFI